MNNRRFFGLLCAHKWKTIAGGKLYAAGSRDMPIGHWADQQCEHCGKLKHKELA